MGPIKKAVMYVVSHGQRSRQRKSRTGTSVVARGLGAAAIVSTAVFTSLACW